ncbi:MAG: hypothetical protein LAQ69_50460 [Acidobacteriia bacterium]|nr:hypothetical protein [Terriglobia bacterium]
MVGRLKPRPRFVIGSNLSLLTIFTLATALIGCNDTTKQRNLATTAARRFQTLYNSGSCEQLYTDASQYFRSHETSVRWSRDCVQLRTRFGRWSHFKPESNNSWPIGGVGIVWVRGPAQFENGEAEVRLDWDIANDHATLFNILIEAGGEQISVPGFTGEVRD